VNAGIALPDKDLAWLNEATVEFSQYVEALQWAQDYAALNRSLMLFHVMGALRETLGREKHAALRCRAWSLPREAQYDGVRY
jgi:RNA-splicing ligase RtcB